MPQETKAKRDLSSDSSDHAYAQGSKADASDMTVLRQAITCAIDYRGDVTVTRQSDGNVTECFLFDQKHHDDPAKHLVRMIPKDADRRESVPLADIAAIEFTGRDTAAGKSFETWMKKYVQKKLAGEKASIESESLEE